jgi:integral membrane protein (TIGR01906 family)
MAPVNSSPAASRVGIVAVALSTALVVVALAIVPYLSPAWVAFEQGRTGAAELSGYTEAQVRTATNTILTDLIVGPPDFDVSISRFPVLTDAERSHMRDVRGVFASFYAAAAVALGILGAAFWLAGRRGSGWTRRDAWRGVRFGAIGLAIGTGVAGVVALVSFDAAFEVFHRLFFANGTYLFDPATSHLVQLFPDAFWSETAIAVGGMILVLAAGTAWLAGRRLRSPAARAGESSAASPDAAGQQMLPAGHGGGAP